MAHLFFDLDGTLTDSAQGITRCLAHAVRELGVEPPGMPELTGWIGSALREIFAALLSTDDEAVIDRAIALYVERFDRIGIRENQLFPGVEAGLARLQQAGHALHVATAKIQDTAEAVVDLFELGGYFTGVHGGSRARGSSKATTLGRALTAHGLEASACLMVGDRHHDIHAAHDNAISSVWVQWGYGTAEERESARPHHVIACFEELDALARSIVV